MKKYQYLILPVVFLVLFIVFTVLVKTVDVQYLKVTNSYIGLYSINQPIYNWVGVVDKMRLAKITSDIIMYVIFIFVAIFAGMGIYQWVKRKSLKLVDKRLFILFGAYVVTALLYLAFEVMKINYAPLVIDGEIKASYPSSHVLISVVFYITGCLTAMSFLSVEHKITRLAIILLSVTMSLLVGFVRLMSGRHWFTDILASYLLASFVITLFRNCFKQMALPPSEQID